MENDGEEEDQTEQDDITTNCRSAFKTQSARQSPTRSGAVARYVVLPIKYDNKPVVTPNNHPGMATIELNTSARDRKMCRKKAEMINKTELNKVALKQKKVKGELNTDGLGRRTN